VNARYLRSGALCLSLLACCASSYAQTYQFSYNGAVTYVDSDLESAGAPGIGIPIFGSFQYDLSAPKLASGPSSGTYPAPFPFFFSVGVLQYSGIGGHTIQNVGVNVGNNSSSPTEDTFGFGAFTGPGEATGSGTSVGGYSLTQIGVVLVDASGTIFDSAALPSSLSIDSFDTHFVRLFYFNGDLGAHRHLDADIANFSLAPVTDAIPEPETYAMLLAGLGLLGFAARRRKQKEAALA